MPVYKPIPIKAATELLKEYDKDEIIILAWDSATGSVHLTTDGSTEDHKANAARGSMAIIKYLEKIGMVSSEGGTVYEDPNNRLAG